MTNSPEQAVLHSSHACAIRIFFRCTSIGCAGHFKCVQSMLNHLKIFHVNEFRVKEDNK